MPQQSFSVSNFYDYVITGSVKRTMKNTITRKPFSFPHPFVLLQIWRVTQRAVFACATEKSATRQWDPSMGKPDCWLEKPVASCFVADMQTHPDESSDSIYLLLPQQQLSSGAEDRK